MTDTIEQVGDVDPTKNTSPIVDGEPESPEKRAICYFNGVAYSTGAYVCSAGSRLFCYGSGVCAVAGPLSPLGRFLPFRVLPMSDSSCA